MAVSGIQPISEPIPLSANRLEEGERPNSAEITKQLVIWPRAIHAVCDRFGDLATASLIENWIDETERRAWFLAQTLSQL